MNAYAECKLCPRKCGVNRAQGFSGFCGADDKVKIARSALHFWEEPCISGERGSGTVFFSHCTMKCVFCQNYKISHSGMGRAVSVKELADCFLKLKDEGAHNINLVTPTHYVPHIIEAVASARNKGLDIPIIYNSGGYENTETIKMLDGTIDVYLPDLKYYDDKYAIRYSGARDYFKTASRALSEMYRQVGNCVFDDNGMIKKGVIVRHLMLPNLLFDSKKIIDHLYTTYGDGIFISIMNQYTPISEILTDFPEIDKKISERYYDSLIDYAAGLGVKNAYIQEGDTAKESFIPEFYGE